MKALIILCLVSLTLAVPFQGFTQCDASAQYHFVVNAVDISVYPIQQAHDVTIQLQGTSDNAYTLTKAVAVFTSLGGLKQTITLNVQLTQGATSADITIPGSQIPSILPDGTYTVQITPYGHTADSSNDVALSCYTLQLQFKKASKKVVSEFLAVKESTPFTGFTQCDASATYPFTVKGVDVSVYPIQQAHDATLSLKGTADKAYTMTRALAVFTSLGGLKQTVTLNVELTQGETSADITIPGSQIPSILPDGTYTVQITPYGHAADSTTEIALSCYTMKLQFKKAPKKMTIIPKYLKLNPTHYGNPSTGCQSDEVAAQITGLNGDACLAKGSKLGTCPSDKPAETTASPKLVLQSSSGDKYCALVCSGLATGVCPNGATCQTISGVGLCLYTTANPSKFFIN